MRATWLLGGTGLLFAAGGAIASPVTPDIAFNESTLPNGLELNDIRQVVAGNNGAVATYTVASGDPYIMLHVGGNTTLISAPDSGFNDYRELSFSPDVNLLTYQAVDPSGNFRLVQANTTGGTPTPIDPAGTNIFNGQSLEDSHYQVNASGTAVFKYRTGEAPNQVQNFSTGSVLVPNTILQTVTDPTSHGLKDFNLPDNGVYRRQAIASDNSVAFFAKDSTSNIASIYRLDSGGTATALFATGATPTYVIGASSNAVLYATQSGGTRTLKLGYDGTAPESAVQLASFTYPHFDGASVVNAVMTQQNRVAYYNSGNQTGEASVGYYDQAHGNVAGIAVENQTIVSDGTYNYQVTRLNIDDQFRGNPMVNDKGVVVFDAILTVQGEVLEVGQEASKVKAFLAWDAGSEQLSIVVKSDLNGDPNSVYSDTFNGFTVLDLVTDTAMNNAGDVLKDGLSEDNYLSFALGYGNNDEQHAGVATIMVPEPAAVSMLAVMAAGLLLRRRRQNCQAN